MSFEPLALWKSNFAEVGFPTRKPLKAWALIFQLRISGSITPAIHGRESAIVTKARPQRQHGRLDYMAKSMGFICSSSRAAGSHPSATGTS
jgi:hypothetical protein